MNDKHPIKTRKKRKSQAAKFFEWAITTPIIAYPRWKLRRKVLWRLEVVEGVIETISEERDRALRLSSEHYVRIYDASLFVTLLGHDLIISISDQLTERQASKRNYYSRQLCMLVFEAIEDLPSVFGKEFRRSLAAIPVSEQLLTELNTLTKRIAHLGHRYATELKEVRTIAAAHRDHDAALQLAVIKKVDDRRISQISKELDVILDDFIRWFGRVISRMGEIRVLLKHLKIVQEPPTPSVS